MRVEVEVRRRGTSPPSPALDYATVAIPEGLAALASPVTQRVAVAKTSVTKQVGGKSTGLIVEAYSDDRFDSPTRFFTAAPEHPKLGKWAQPSTLKHSHHASNDAGCGSVCSFSRQTIHHAVASLVSFASLTHGSAQSGPDPKAAGSSKRHTESVARKRATARGSSSKAAGPDRSACQTSRIRRRVESATSRSPPRAVKMEASIGARAESAPLSWSRDKKHEHTAPLRTDTPISGRVAQLHPRMQQEHHQQECHMSSVVFCGSFHHRRREQQQPPPENHPTATKFSIFDLQQPLVAGTIDRDQEATSVDVYSRESYDRLQNGNVADDEKDRICNNVDTVREATPGQPWSTPGCTAGHVRTEGPEVKYRVKLGCNSDTAASHVGDPNGNHASTDGTKVDGRKPKDGRSSLPTVDCRRASFARGMRPMQLTETETTKEQPTEGGGKRDRSPVIRKRGHFAGPSDTFVEGNKTTSIKGRENAMATASNAEATDLRGQHLRQQRNSNHNLANGGGGVAGARVQTWIAREVDPFLAALRQALTRDRPRDVGRFSAEFSEKWHNPDKL